MRWHVEGLDVQVVTLLLHQHRVGEALSQMRSHLTAFRVPPVELPPGPAAAHQAWLARQHAVLGDLLAARADPAALPMQVRMVSKTILTHL